MKCRSRPRYSRTPRRPPRRPPQRRPRPRKQPPIIPETSTGGSPPTSFELLQEAVLALKEERRGVSLPDIRRQMLKKYKGRFDKASNDLLTSTLKRLAERGKVIYRQGYKYMFNAPQVTKHKQNRDDTHSENDTNSGAITNSGANTSSYASATTTSGGSATTEHTEYTIGRSLDSRTSASSQSDTRTRSTGTRSSKSSKSCTKSTKDTKSTKNTKSSTKSTKSIRSVRRKEAQDEPQDQEKAPQDDAQSPEKVEEEEKSSAIGEFSSSVAATGYTTSKGSQDSSKRRR